MLSDTPSKFMMMGLVKRWLGLSLLMLMDGVNIFLIDASLASFLKEQKNRHSGLD